MVSCQDPEIKKLVARLEMQMAARDAQIVAQNEDFASHNAKIAASIEKLTQVYSSQ